jgi:hypothetical protein
VIEANSAASESSKTTTVGTVGGVVAAAIGGDLTSIGFAAAGAALGGETQESGLVRTASERVGEVAGTTRESARSHMCGLMTFTM